MYLPVTHTWKCCLEITHSLQSMCGVTNLYIIYNSEFVCLQYTSWQSFHQIPVKNILGTWYIFWYTLGTTITWDWNTIPEYNIHLNLIFWYRISLILRTNCWCYLIPYIRAVEIGRSTISYFVFYQGVTIDNCTHVPVPVAQSSSESDYNAACTTVMALEHFRMLNNELITRIQMWFQIRHL